MPNEPQTPAVVYTPEFKRNLRQKKIIEEYFLFTKNSAVVLFLPGLNMADEVCCGN